MAPGSGGSGGLTRRAALALIGGGGLLSVSASGAFDRVDANRPFELEVDDENAVLDIETFSPIEVGSSGEEVDVVELHNRFPDASFDSVSVTTDSSILSIIEPLERGETLDNGERITVRGRVESDRSRTTNVELTITVSGSSERIETTRTVEVVARGTGSPDACPVSPVVNASVKNNAGGPISSDGDRTVKNEDIDGDVVTTPDSEGDITVKNATITGDVIADGDIDITNAVVGGDVKTRSDSEGDIGVTNSEIGGDVIADGNIGGDDDNDPGIKNTLVVGRVETRADGEGSITIQMTGNREVIGGGIVSDGDIDIQNGLIGGDVETRADSEGDIELQNTAICGAATADGDINTGNNSEIGGDLTTRTDSEGDIDIGSNTTIYGSVTAGGDVTISNNAVVKGDVTTRNDSEGDVTVDGTVEGGVFADGDVDGSGTINGNDPRASSGG